MDVSKTIYSVSALTREIKILLEDSFPSLWVEGEISNYKKHYSGHYYFTLKDSESQISCVMWRTRTYSLPFEIEDGMKVQVFGNLRLFEKSGRYQIDTILIQQAGIGELQLKFEELKKKLLEEGLFDDEHKQQIPVIPDCIGVITSPTGAAVKDIISVLQRRFPPVEIIVHGVKVQGDGAAAEIVNAVKNLNSMGGIDTIILGRGGGSLEDLWAFNEEEVARAIFASRIPIISAVGHEIDFTIADFVADLRAPTPSAAAEIAVPNAEEIRESIFSYQKDSKNILQQYIAQSRESVLNLLKSYAFRKPEDIVHQYYQKIDDLMGKLNLYYLNQLKESKAYINSALNQLAAFNPKNVLKRGYSLIYKEQELIKSVKQVEVDETILIKLSDGSLDSKIRKKNYE